MLTPLTAMVLLLAAAAGAFVTTAAGIGGGVFLLAVMSALVPVAVLIPLHGAVQAAANGWRTLLFLRSIRWPVVLVFTAGCVLGAAAGAPLLVQIPLPWLELLLAGFILLMVWSPGIGGVRQHPGVLPLGGAITGALTLFVGATGPFVSALLAGHRWDRFVHVGTFAACMAFQHVVKLVVFGLLGFALGEYLPLLVAMILCSLAGTLAGRRVLHAVNNCWFHRLLAVLLTLLALRLLWSGATALWGL